MKYTSDRDEFNVASGTFVHKSIRWCSLIPHFFSRTDRNTSLRSHPRWASSLHVFWMTSSLRIIIAVKSPLSGGAIMVASIIYSSFDCHYLIVMFCLRPSGDDNRKVRRSATHDIWCLFYIYTYMNIIYLYIQDAPVDSLSEYLVFDTVGVGHKIMVKFHHGLDEFSPWKNTSQKRIWNHIGCVSLFMMNKNKTQYLGRIWILCMLCTWILYMSCL